MKRIRRLVVVVSAMHAVACLGGDDARLALAEYARHPPSGLTVVSGSVTLPGKGVWEVIDPLPPQLAGVFLEAPEAVYNAVMGRRGQALQQERQEQDHQSALRSPYWVLSRWAHAHAGRMPTLAELDAEGQKSVERALACLPALPETLLRQPSSRPHLDSAAARCSLLSIADWRGKILLSGYFADCGVAFHCPISNCQVTSVG